MNNEREKEIWKVWEKSEGEEKTAKKKFFSLRIFLQIKKKELFDF